MKQNIHELSKKILNNYFNKAHDEIMGIERDHFPEYGGTKKLTSKVWKKYNNRAIGMGKAYKKLTKEDTVNELSAHTLGNYLTRARRNKQAHDIEWKRNDNLADVSLSDTDKAVGFIKKARHHKEKSYFRGKGMNT